MQVDYSGFSTINTQRFGQHFVGKVANPNDVLLWQKSSARKAQVGIVFCNIIHGAQDLVVSYSCHGSHGLTACMS